MLIVEGGPGTGKSVVAVNLLVELTKRELVAQYITRNSAPRKVYEARLTGAFKKSNISNLFGSTGAFHGAEAHSYDCLLVDEAHRLNAKSGLFQNKGENQIKEIIQASNCSVFFIDEDQRVTLKDVGEKSEIRRWAKKAGAFVTEMRLESQFRCNGSGGYLTWVDSVLQLRPGGLEADEQIDYDLRVIDRPLAMHELIRDKNRSRNKARVVAGYCWKWISKKKPGLRDIVIDDYRATWNLERDGQGWLIMPDSVSEVGCVHTCQGLELDYVGVIIGPDLVVRNGRIITNAMARAPEDKSIHGWKTLLKSNKKEAELKLDGLIKNTYRTLMTRGQKGCFIYCVDKETQEYFKREMRRFPEGAPRKPGLPVLHERRRPPSALPLIHLRAVANPEFRNLEGLFAEEDSCEWVSVGGECPRENRFLVRIEGDSMEPLIPNGSICLFRKDPGGSRNGKIVLCRIDSLAGGGPLAVVKKYRSFREEREDGLGQAKIIVLSSLNPLYRNIQLTEGEEVTVVGVFEKVIPVVLRGQV